MKKELVLISACLLGENCKYDGSNNEIKQLKNLNKFYDLIPFCPEVSGGMKTPRFKSEIKENKVINEKGKDVTDLFLDGAYWAYLIAFKYKIKLAILKEKSPSCGVYKIYDGSFSNKLIDGQGITAKKLIENGVKVINEEEAILLLKKLEENE